jgi:hypothetical protein
MTTWKIHHMDMPHYSRPMSNTVLRNERETLEATIIVRDYDDVQICIKPVAGSRANHNHALAEAARLVSMCYDTLGDTEHDRAKNPREKLLQCTADLQYLVDEGGLLVRGRDAAVVVLPCFEGVVDALMTRYF